jgi:hypothetical protein
MLRRLAQRGGSIGFSSVLVTLCVILLVFVAASASAQEDENSIRESGIKWLKAKSKEEGVTSLPSGTMFREIRQGVGASPRSSDQVQVHFVGYYAHNQKIFVNSKANMFGETAIISMDKTIQGFYEPLLIMKEGAIFELFIPPELGYGGDRVSVVTMELVKVLRRPSVDDKPPSSGGTFWSNLLKGRQQQQFKQVINKKEEL